MYAMTLITREENILKLCDFLRGRKNDKTGMKDKSDQLNINQKLMCQLYLVKLHAYSMCKSKVNTIRRNLSLSLTLAYTTQSI
jgi:hypothetical protein